MRTKQFFRGALILALLALSACAPSREVSITFGGDVMLARNGLPLFFQDPWGKFAQEPMVGNMFFVNLESPLADPDSTTTEQLLGYNLCADAEQAKWLAQGGVNLVTAENNHKSDCGPGGADTDARLLESAKITVVGGADNPLVYEEEGVRVGVIAVDAVTQTPDQTVLIQQVKALRPNVEILVVSIHWGSEYQAGVEDVRNELAQLLADSGVDVVWGHHPHVLQKAEVIHSSVTGRDTLVLFSLGNLLSDQYMREDTQRSALVTATFKNGQLLAVQATPVYMDRVGRSLIEPSVQDSQKILEALNWEEIQGSGLTVIQP